MKKIKIFRFAIPLILVLAIRGSYCMRMMVTATLRVIITEGGQILTLTQLF